MKTEILQIFFAFQLKKTAETLQKDAQNFNEFVKANDESAVNAMRASERESRLKLEKVRAPSDGWFKLRTFLQTVIITQ